MKSKTTLLILALLSFSFCSAQTLGTPDGGGEFVFNPQKSECLTELQRQEIFTQLNKSINKLNLQKKLAFSKSNIVNHPLFTWPVQKASSTLYNEVWAISNYVDQNQNYPDQLTDYNCGSKTYDTTSGYNHQGVDVFSWPFGWSMMDNDEAEIIAAAPGQIIYKSDGNFDRSCDFNTTTPWNAVYVQHNDGSIAWYGHLKNGSLTNKNVGDMVSATEFLGVMGSSGVSTGPHLHFEVYTDNSYTQLVDTYAGTCNSLNTDSWWQNQKPYTNPSVNAVLTHTAPPVFNTCPTTETTNRSDNFNTNDTIYCALYLKDQEAGTSVNLKVRRPDNSLLYDWNFQLTDNFLVSWWYWNFSGVFDMNGTWQWEATYNGQTTTHSFNVSGALSVNEESFESASIYPNPFNNIVTFNSTIKIKSSRIIDVLGKTVLTIIDNSAEGIKELNLSELSNGMYFITLEGEQNQKKTIKLIKK